LVLQNAPQKFQSHHCSQLDRPIPMQFLQMQIQNLRRSTHELALDHRQSLTSLFLQQL